MSIQFAGNKTINAATIFQAFNTVVHTVDKWLQQENRTRVTVARVNAQRDTTIAGIEAQRDFLLRSLDLVFDERRESFRELFGRLETALQAGNSEAVASILSTITELATQSPFADLRDHRIIIEHFQSDETWEV